jgi:hypothetical protein
MWRSFYFLSLDLHRTCQRSGAFFASIARSWRDQIPLADVVFAPERHGCEGERVTVCHARGKRDARIATVQRIAAFSAFHRETRYDG